MNDSIKIINELLVELFNDILTIEKEALQSGPFKDLSITEMHVLEAIGMHKKTMTDVASQLGVTVGTLTTSVNRLVKKEYVIRTRSEEDRRIVHIELSRKGKLAYRLHEKFHTDMVKTMTDKLSDEDNEVLIASLNRLSQFFKEQYHLQ
ncbi:MarR family transcriptional regulator [Sporanaerobium hydrogeniformans]|uniref:MarR family transcriptional regulator n=1 Tax=Sporanaerobium hydrogeniformans TaxID=3072179 RepID=A0AC61D9Q1_9FIRM|nr:MarR family transcriptional regulator [Sporanaerobium hydrogeniformans]PHV69287.1 MarR family transcriptional regulator [Sporanaerobium hydrogeniformans]